MIDYLIRAWHTPKIFQTGGQEISLWLALAVVVMTVSMLAYVLVRVVEGVLARKRRA